MNRPRNRDLVLGLNRQRRLDLRRSHRPTVLCEKRVARVRYAEKPPFLALDDGTHRGAGWRRSVAGAERTGGWGHSSELAAMAAGTRKTASGAANSRRSDAASGLCGSVRRAPNAYEFGCQGH